jgi:hypothetical protein
MAVMRDTGETRLTQVRGKWRISFVANVRIPELDGLVCGAGNKFAFWSPAKVFDDIIVSPDLPYLLS